MANGLAMIAEPVPATVKPREVYRPRVPNSDLLLSVANTDRCSSQSTGKADAVFLLEAGATLKNVIIGKNQAEGVHCDGHCTLEYVWFEDVCEDAISIKNDKAGSQSWIIGGGAYHASDKVIQHNGCGTVNIINYVSCLSCCIKARLIALLLTSYFSCHSTSKTLINCTVAVATASLNASVMCISKGSLPKMETCWSASTATMAILLPPRTLVAIQRPSVRCSRAVLVVVNLSRRVYAPGRYFPIKE